MGIFGGIVLREWLGWNNDEFSVFELVFDRFTFSHRIATAFGKIDGSPDIRRPAVTEGRYNSLNRPSHLSDPPLVQLVFVAVFVLGKGQGYTIPTFIDIEEFTVDRLTQVQRGMIN